MGPILALAKRYHLYVIEDTAQAIGSVYTFAEGSKMQAGTMGDIGCTSFFPSKNLGCYGDGGAVYTKNEELAKKIKMIANHGQVKKYIHKYISVNSRLDTIQAAILDIKLKHLDVYIKARQNAASVYDNMLSNVDEIIIPTRVANSSHVFHQYTLIVKDGKRDALKDYLHEAGIPAMVYYPIPLNEQEAFKTIGAVAGSLDVTNDLCKSVISLPMHTELTLEQQTLVSNKIKNFFNN